MKGKKLILNAIILTFTTMTLGFISMGFRVYLSNKIGPEGMGLYQLITSIYVMTSTLSISGIRVTTTRLVAEELGKGNKQKIKNVMKKAFIYSLFFSTLASLLLYNSAEFIGNLWINDARSIIPLKILSCSLPFVGLGACFHGYFYGMRKVVRSVTSDILENVTMMSVIAYFISIFLPKGLDYTCALVSVGMSLGVIVSTFFCYIMYSLEKKTIYKKDFNSSFGIMGVASIAFPIACSSYIQTGLRTIEDILIPDALRKFGSSTSGSLAIFGMVKGMVLPILVFPSIFLASFSTLIIPEIAESNALNKKVRVNYIISRVFKFTLLIAIFSSGIFMIFSDELGFAIYKNNDVGVMMRILAPLIPFMYLDRIVDSSLNALNQQLSTLRYNLIDMAVRISLIYFLIPKTGINGFIAVLFTGTLLNASLSINRLLKVTKLEFDIFDWIIKPAICITLACFSIKISFDIFSFTSSLIIELILVIILYFILLRFFGCIKKEDVSWFIDGFKNDIAGLNCTDLSIYKRL